MLGSVQKDRNGRIIAEKTWIINKTGGEEKGNLKLPIARENGNS